MSDQKVTSEEALKFLESAVRNWSHVPPLTADDIADVATELTRFRAAKDSPSSIPDDDGEPTAWAVLDMDGGAFHSVHIFKEDAERHQFGLGSVVPLRAPATTCSSSGRSLADLIEASKVRLAAMTEEERQAMWQAQRESFARAMSTPCEHGVLDFEQCDECRNPAQKDSPVSRTEGRTDRDDGITIGIAMSIAFMLRDRDEPVIAREWWEAAGLTIEQCERVGMDDYDLDPIREFLNATKENADV